MSSNLLYFFLGFFEILSFCLQVDKDEVRLRRTIGVKKDEYFLDGKHITCVSVIFFRLRICYSFSFLSLPLASFDDDCLTRDSCIFSGRQKL